MRKILVLFIVFMAGCATKPKEPATCESLKNECVSDCNSTGLLNFFSDLASGLSNATNAAQRGAVFRSAGSLSAQNAQQNQFDMCVGRCRQKQDSCDKTGIF